MNKVIAKVCYCSEVNSFLCEVNECKGKGFGRFCALELKVFKIKVWTSLAGNSVSSVPRALTQEFLLWKYTEVARSSVWPNSDECIFSLYYYHHGLWLKMSFVWCVPIQQSYQI